VLLLEQSGRHVDVAAWGVEEPHSAGSRRPMQTCLGCCTGISSATPRACSARRGGLPRPAAIATRRRIRMWRGPGPRPGWWGRPALGSTRSRGVHCLLLCSYGAPVPGTMTGRPLRDTPCPASANCANARWCWDVARTRFRFWDLSAASAMAVGSLGPLTTMSFRLAIGH
jgi:hypothetical protein